MILPFKTRAICAGPEPGMCLSWRGVTDSPSRKSQVPDFWTLNGAGPGLRGAGPGPKGNPAPRYPPAGDSRSTLADGALDFRVRNGNGYDRPSMGTGVKTHPVGR